VSNWTLADFGDSLIYSKHRPEGFLPLTPNELAEIEAEAVRRLGSRQTFEECVRYMERKPGAQFAGPTTMVIIPNPDA
jgi:hypothetical protein